MGDWRPVEVYATFMKVTGEIEVGPGQRLSDEINRLGEFVEMRYVSAEPLSVNHPVLSRREQRATLAKSTVILICPVDPGSAEMGAHRAMWREKEAIPVAINTAAFSMVADVHVEPRHSLRDQLERYRGDFLPVTNLSALWVATLNEETHSVQRSFALLNPAAILSFAPR